jgi:hypothetical protein
MDLRELAGEVMQREQRADTPFGLYLLSSDDPGAELARSVERQVFYDFFGNTPELLAAEYARYEEATFFLCVVDHLRRLPAGMIRIIRPSATGFKTLSDLEHVWGQPAPAVFDRSGIDLRETTTWDFATLAVSPEYRGPATAGLVSLALYQGSNVAAVHLGIEWAIAVLDLVALDLIQTSFHSPFSAFDGCDPRSYLDSPSSLPVYCDVKAFHARLELAHPDTYSLLHNGEGLESVLSSPFAAGDEEVDLRWLLTA